MCKVLVQNGCDLTITDTTNKMASHLAKKYNRMEVYDYLNAEYQALKEQKKAPVEQEPEPNQPQETKKPKAKKKDPPATPALPKSQTTVYRLYRSDNFGNANEVSYEEFEELMSQYPELSEMIKHPDEIDMSQLEAIKDEDAWQKKAFRILTMCSKAKGGFYFNDPVDPSKYNIEDYFDIITEPMDFGTIKKKLNHNVYENIEEFTRDMNLVFDNCVLYNGVENMIAKHALEIKVIFEENMRQAGL